MRDGSEGGGEKGEAKIHGATVPAPKQCAACTKHCTTIRTIARARVTVVVKDSTNTIMVTSEKTEPLSL